MAKKSLTKAIEELVNSLDTNPSAEARTLKNPVMALVPLAQALEDGAAVREAEAQVAALETALEESNAENANLKAELNAAQAEIETFRAEQKKQEEEKKREQMPDIQFEILQRLPTEHLANDVTLERIARRCRIPPDEAAVHLNRLEKAGYAQHRSHYVDPVGTVASWHRTIGGDELVLAKRLAGEEEAEQRDPDRFGAPLSQSQQLVLLKVAKSNGVTPEELAEQLEEALPTLGRPIWTPQSVLLLLITLREKQMVIDQPAPSHKTPRKWIARRKGMEYLSELGQL